MDKLKIQADWFEKIFPEGILIPSSIMLSGPGGSGKPLVGNFIVAEWLKRGGSVVFMSLQYPDHRFIKSSLNAITKLNLHDYIKNCVFIELDATIDGMEEIEDRHFKANVVKRDIWDAALVQACKNVPDEGPGILIFASALNLLLFSPTYGNEILERIKSTIQDETHRSFLFSVSTTAKAKEIAELEAIVDNLMMVRMEKETMQLFIQAIRVKGVAFISEHIRIPISKENLLSLKAIADDSRKRVIPIVSKI